MRLNSYDFLTILLILLISFMLDGLKVALNIPSNGNTIDDVKFFLTFTYEIDRSKSNGVEL